MRGKVLISAVCCVVFVHPGFAGELGSVGGMLGGSAGGPVFATPLPHGPGTVPMPYPAGPMVAPVLLPVGAATVAPVAIYQYPNALFAVGAPCEPTQTVADPLVESATTPDPKHTGHRFYSSMDFLYGATQGTYLPPLVTASPAGTPGAAAGVLYSPTTAILFGGQRQGEETRPGMRLNLGYWCNDERSCGLDVGFLFLGRLTNFYNELSQPGRLILARPAVNGVTSENIAFPFGTTGSAGIAASFNTAFVGGDVNWRKGLGADGKFDLLVGFRYLYLKDNVEIATTQGVEVPVPATIAYTSDQFRSVNNFFGPQVGFTTHCPLPAGFSLDILTKLAMGVTVADTTLSGYNLSAAAITTPGGLLVGPTNAGAYSTSRYAVVPEIGVKLGYDLTESLRFTFGYTMIYWSAVQRAPEQIDLTLFSPGRPAYPNRFDDVWLQGWTGGLSWRY